MLRYFIYETGCSYSNGSMTANGYVITDGIFPSRSSIMNRHGIYFNVQNYAIITEVKSVEDLKQCLEDEQIRNEINYPFAPKEYDSSVDYDEAIYNTSSASKVF